MHSNTTNTFSKLNLPLIALWFASVAVAAIGYLLVSSANADQVAIYTAAEADYAQLFTAQSTSTVGSMLIAAGVLGLLLALTAHAITRRSVSTFDRDMLDFDDVDIDEIEDELSEVAPAQDVAAPATKKPAAKKTTEPAL